MAQTLSIKRLSISQQALLVTVCWLFLWVAPIQALDYEPIPLVCLLARSDSIVLARLPIHANGDRYKVTIQEIFSGKDILSKDVMQSLLVQEPAIWRGTQPVMQYSLALLFLRIEKKTPARVLGPSGEGRIPLTEETVYLHGISVPDASQSLESYPRLAFLAAVRAATHCYRFEATGKKVTAIRRCSITELTQAEMQNGTMRNLQQQLFKQLQMAQTQPMLCPFE